MNRLSFRLTFLLLVVFADRSGAQPPTMQDTDDVVSSFKPSLAVVLAILALMFTLTFFLLLYAKKCGRRSSGQRNFQTNPALVRTNSRLSGIDKTVIESLPFFRFSSLKGSKQGLECAVCLSKFEDIEILRLLPKCKHAFHINCIDQWLERHSSCPLCRHRVSADDPAVFTYSNSMRLLFNNNSDLRDESNNVEIFIQREEDNLGSSSSSSSRFKNIGDSFRKLVGKEADNKDEELLIDDGDKMLHKFKHKIIVSDVIFKNRWSNASSSDLMFLNSEMLNATSSNRFSTFDENIPSAPTKYTESDQIMQIKEEMEMKRLFESKVSNTNKTSILTTTSKASTTNKTGILTTTATPIFIPASEFPSTSDGHYSNDTLTTAYTSRTIDSSERRSVSEISGLPRFKDLRMENGVRESSTLDGNERTRRVWLPIARRTIQWFANRERRSQQFQNPSRTLDV